MSDPPASGGPKFRLVPAVRPLGETRASSIQSTIAQPGVPSQPIDIDYASVQPPPLREPTSTHHTIAQSGVPPSQHINYAPVQTPPLRDMTPVQHRVNSPMIEQDNYLTQRPSIPAAAHPTPPNPSSLQFQQPGTRQGSVERVDPVAKSVKLFQTLLRNKPDDVRPRLINLVTSLIYESIDPEAFTERLQEVLSSKAQPQLLTFLRESLPVLRQAIAERRVIYKVDGDQASIEFANKSSSQVVAATPGGFPTGSPSPGISHQPSPGMIQKPMGTPQPNLQVMRTQPPVSQNQGTPLSHLRSNETQMSVKVESMDVDEPNISELRRELQPVQQASTSHIEEASTTVAPSEEETTRPYKEPPFSNTLIQPGQIMTKITQRMNTACYVDEELVTLISDAAEYRIRELVAELGVMAQHRLDPNPKLNSDYFVLDDTKSQIKWLETMDRQLEEQRTAREKEEALRMGKGKGGSTKDSIERAKEMQRVEAEEKRAREANAAAIAALSSSKSKTNRWDAAGAGSTAHQTLRTRAIRVNMRDFHAVFAANPRNRRSTLLHKLALATPPTDLSL